MRRRDFIKVAAGSAVTWPLAAHAQQVERTRLIGVLMGWSETDPQYRSRADALVEGLAALGWTDKSNLRLDVRWINGDVERAPALAKELVEQKPDVLVAVTTVAAAALLHETRTIPIVFFRSIRSRWCRLCTEFAATGSQHDRLHQFRSQHGRKMA
jgi:putative tryptophan/tyrosine transport system substrate-binding protein